MSKSTTKLRQKPKPDRTIDGRRYYDTTGRCWPSCQECEHCDGENGPFVRHDFYRGNVCPSCDEVLDEMLGETPLTPAPIAEPVQ